MQNELTLWNSLIDNYSGQTKAYLRQSISAENERVMTALLKELGNEEYPASFRAAYIQMHLDGIVNLETALACRPDTERKRILGDLLIELSGQVAAILLSLHPKVRAVAARERKTVEAADPGSLVFRMRAGSEAVYHFLIKETEDRLVQYRNTDEQIQLLQAIIAIRKLEPPGRWSKGTSGGKDYEAEFIEWLEEQCATRGLLQRKLPVKLTYRELGVFFSLMREANVIRGVREKDMGEILSRLFDCRPSTLEKGKKANQIQVALFSPEPRQLKQTRRLLEKLLELCKARMSIDSGEGAPISITKAVRGSMQGVAC